MDDGVIVGKRNIVDLWRWPRLVRLTILVQRLLLERNFNDITILFRFANNGTDKGELAAYFRIRNQPMFAVSMRRSNKKQIVIRLPYGVSDPMSASPRSFHPVVQMALRQLGAHGLKCIEGFRGRVRGPLTWGAIGEGGLKPLADVEL